jgi:hypothetical protein
MTWIGYVADKDKGVTSQNVHPNSHKYGVSGQHKAIVIPIREIRGSNLKPDIDYPNLLFAVSVSTHKQMLQTYNTSAGQVPVRISSL